MEKITEEKICKQCTISFTIQEEDKVFYELVSPTYNGKKYSIPTPEFCPDCRAQRILSTRNERNLYRRKCDATGKEIVSIHSPDTTFPVYDQNYWWGDAWNPFDYGRDFDFSRPFFEQFIELFHTVPKISLNAPMSQNSEFTNQCQGNRDCYMMFCSGNNESCYYGMWNQECKFCSDCLYIEFTQHCYQLINGIKCYNCYFSSNLEACSDIYVSRDLVNCKHCIGCVNLQNREYCIFNEQYSKQEYETKKQLLQLDTYFGIHSLQQQFQTFSKNHPVKYYNGKKNERFSGDYVQNSKEAYIAFNCRDNDVSKYCRDSWRVIKSYDLIETLIMEYCIEVEGTSYANRCFFSAKLSKADRVLYSSHCNGVQDLFGCVGINNRSYCIFNKQYTKEQYDALVPQIIEHMQKTGEWGKFFPPEMSPFGYNETVAQEYFPLTKEQALSKGFFWSDYETPFAKVEKIIPAQKLPETIGQVPDDILNWAIECEATKKPFRITSQELEFYRQHHFPVPHLHHNERHVQRMNQRNPRKLQEQVCQQCKKHLQTTFSVNNVLCEECYNKEVY